MSSIETFAIFIGWAATCFISWLIGYLTRSEEEGRERY